jgi:hypothetical protein
MPQRLRCPRKWADTTAESARSGEFRATAGEAASQEPEESTLRRSRQSPDSRYRNTKYNPARKAAQPARIPDGQRAPVAPYLHVIQVEALNRTDDE